MRLKYLIRMAGTELQELYELKQRIVDKDMRLDAANKLVADYKAKVNELQKQIIGLETNNEFH